MKFLFAVVATLAFDGVSAFSVQQHGAMRKESALSMTAQAIEKKEIKVGVIGAGRIGLVHLEAITKAPGVVPVVISNPTISKAEAGKFFRKIDLDSRFPLVWCDAYSPLNDEFAPPS